MVRPSGSSQKFTPSSPERPQAGEARVLHITITNVLQRSEDTETLQGPSLLWSHTFVTVILLWNPLGDPKWGPVGLNEAPVLTVGLYCVHSSASGFHLKGGLLRVKPLEVASLRQGRAHCAASDLAPLGCKLCGSFLRTSSEHLLRLGPNDCSSGPLLIQDRELRPMETHRPKPVCCLNCVQFRMLRAQASLSGTGAPAPTPAWQYPKPKNPVALYLPSETLLTAPRWLGPCGGHLPLGCG